MSGKAVVIRGNALHLPLPDESVDLIITSPPYFALRSYRDSGEHYTGQIGSEPTPQEWLEALWACMAEWWRVLKPTGSCFINLGDKRAGSGGHNNSGITTAPKKSIEQAVAEQKARERAKGYSGGDKRALAREASRRNAPDRYNQAAFGRPKSRMALPERFVIGCMDGKADPEGIGWIYRQDLIWHKLNGLPESVTDRHRDNFEHIFHFTKQERYFAAMDEIREEQRQQHDPYVRSEQVTDYGLTNNPNNRGDKPGRRMRPGTNRDGQSVSFTDPLGKLPGSVWPMASEPLIIPAWAKEKFNLPDHFAAFPSELPRKLILAFSPSGICVECGQGRRPVVEKRYTPEPNARRANGRVVALAQEGTYGKGRPGGPESEYGRADLEATITGYACAPGCDSKNPTRPAVVADPFAGTGTVPMVAKQLGRIGIGIDLSADYCRLAAWRIAHPPGKVMERTWQERQGTLL